MYTFLTVLHVIVCIFLMLVVLLQAGRGGGIGLAFGGSGGSQSVFGSSGGATFLTKLTAICAVLFMTNSLVLAYMSSQSDSRRLQRIAEKKSQDKKAEDAANAKTMTDIEKQREEKAKAAAQKDEAEPGSAPAEEPTGEEQAQGKVEGKPDDKAPGVAGKPGDLKPSTALKLTLPDPAGSKPAAAGKLAAGLKLERPVVVKTEEKPAVEKKQAAAKKPAVEKKSNENSAEKPAAE